MTAEPAPTDDRHEPEAQPALRASHADRDRTVDVLRDAAGDGRLTASELDQRVESALAARTGSELAELTADLPAEPGQQAKELVRIDQRFGDLIVRLGDVKVRHATDPVPVALRVVLTGRVRGGSLTARFPRRTFRQWLHRERGLAG
jgi:Domain of unknown function (DUF1707)